MSEGSDGAEREHSASAKRRSDFSSKGEVPKSKDLLNAVVLLVGVRCVISMGGSVGNVIMSDMRSTLGQLHRDLDSGLMYEFGSHFCHSVLPISALAALAAVVSGLVQHRGVPPWHLPGFDLNRVNPIGKVGELFNPKKAAVTIGIALLKAATLAVIFYATLNQPLRAYVERVPSSIQIGMGTAGGLIKKVLTRGLVMMVLFGILDYVQSWWRLEKRMKMTVQELRDENKEDNGDPKIKGRRRKLAQQLIQQRSVKNVAKADVVLVNPTHFAVAISYKDGRMAAPTVVAKGADALAEKIRSVARSSGVPIVSQPPLTRLLYAEVKVGGAIPAATYQAVAVILAHVYRLRRRAS